MDNTARRRVAQRDVRSLVTQNVGTVSITVLSERLPTLSIITPARNKVATIRRTYDSLLRQTVYDFEWVVINDGSTDGTREILDSFTATQFPISILHQEHLGLSRTVNTALQVACGQFVLRLDADDFLTEDAVLQVLQHLYLCRQPNICGLVFLMSNSQGRVIGKHPFCRPFETDFVDYELLYHGRGDRLEVIKRKVYLQYPLPELPDETFCPECVTWQNMAQSYRAVYLPHSIGIHEYYEDGITRNIVSHLRANPSGAVLAYQNTVRTLLERKQLGRKVAFALFTAAINHYRYAFSSARTRRTRLFGIPAGIHVAAIVIGAFFCLSDTIVLYSKKV